MKKLAVTLLVLVLSLTFLNTALAEDGPESAPAEGIALFDSEWYNEDATVRISNEDAGFKVTILKQDGSEGGFCWEYSTLYNAETKTLDAVGVALKQAFVYLDDGGIEMGDTLYEEEADAAWEVNENGLLVWRDGKEDAGKDLTFEKIGWFDCTTWACDRAYIQMFWEEEGYKVSVVWSSSAWEESVWEYSCFYHPETNTIESMPFGMRTDFVYNENGDVVSANVIYEDGEAAFSLDSDGFLVWQDAKENAGEGMRFEQIFADDVADEADNG